jgi:hypothetical protein
MRAELKKHTEILMSKRLATAAFALLILPALANGIFIWAFPHLTHAAFGQGAMQTPPRDEIHKLCDEKGGQFVESGGLYSCAWHRADCAADGRCGEAQPAKANLAIRMPATTINGGAGSTEVSHVEQSCANQPPLDRCEDLQISPTVSQR